MSRFASLTKSLLSLATWKKISSVYLQSAFATRWCHAFRKDFAVHSVPYTKLVTLSKPADYSDKPKMLQNENLNHMFWKLKEMGPAFAVNPDSISFFYSPAEFFQSLLKSVQSARQRIVMCSLYFGVEKECIQLVDEMMKALQKNSDLKITILIDYLRGTRGIKQKQDSLTLLLPLFLAFPNQVQLRFFHTPLLNGIWKSMVPERVAEIIGVQHIKAYLFDDTLIMSGANLSQSYFTNRLDRYIRVADEPKLSDYFARLIDTIASFSYQPNTAGELHLSTEVDSPFREPEKFARLARSRLLPLLNTEFNQHLSYTTPHDTYIFPLLQMSPFEIQHEEEATSFLLDFACPQSCCYITSPYFNLNPHYVSLVMRGKGQVEIITAHPEANGFFTAKGMAGGIPAAYTHVEKQFFHKIQLYSQTGRIRVFEWRKSGWTYHAKGLWYSPEGSKPPAITLIGSSNLGIRSARRDLEAQLFIVTENAALRAKIDDERRQFFNSNDLTPVHEGIFAAKDRQVPFSVRLVAELIRTFL